MVIGELAEKIGLQVEEFKEIFEIYLETTASSLKELDDALTVGDAAKVHQKAHSLKGSSANLHLNQLFELAEEIDNHASKNILNGVETLVQEFREKYEKLVEDFEDSKEG